MKRLHASLFLAAGFVTSASGQFPQLDKAGPAQPNADARRLFADARAARATWKDFPGFTAELTVHHEGRVRHGRVIVENTGRVHCEHLDDPDRRWAEKLVGRLVEQRLEGYQMNETACAVAGDEPDHPLGRVLISQTDPLGLQYRVRERQITVISRRAQGHRWTATTLEHHINPEGQYLPTALVVHDWRVGDGELHKVKTYFQTWKRVGRFDLPLTTRVIVTVPDAGTFGERTAALPPAQTHAATTLTFANHQLLAPPVVLAGKS